MNTRSVLSLALILLFSFVSKGIAQEGKAPNYAAKPLSEWIDAFKNGTDWQSHMEARRALGPNGPYAKIAVSAIIEAFKDSVHRDGAKSVIADYGPAALPQLLSAMRRKETLIRTRVAETLGKFRPPLVEALPALLAALKDPAPEVRRAAAWSLFSLGRPTILGRVNPKSGEVLAALMGSLRADPNAEVRAAAARSLRILGRRHPEAVRLVGAALEDKDDTVREAASRTLVDMGEFAKPALAALIGALKNRNQNVRADAAFALGIIGPEAKAAVPALIEGIRNKQDRAIGWRYACALEGIGPGAKEAVPALIDALGQGDERSNDYYAQALGAIGPAAKAAVPALMGAVKKGNKEGAVEALGKIGSAAEPAVPLLIEVLTKDKKPSGQARNAAEALGGIGPDAKAALPALAAIAQNLKEDPDLREAAAHAVTRIDPELAAKLDIETACLNVRLRKVPSVRLAPRKLTDAQKKRFRELICQLADATKPVFDTFPPFGGPAFAPHPVKKDAKTFVKSDRQDKAAAAFHSLVEAGPDALPFLLEGLSNRTPTNWTIEISLGAMAGMGGLLVDPRWPRNPLQPLEKRAWAMSKDREYAFDEEKAFDQYSIDSYTIKVGDICLVAIGQIVGRSYENAWYRPIGFLCDIVRSIWAGPDPAQKLLDSLLLDFSTEGRFDGDSLNYWHEGNNLQIESALRLLYYFPKETAPLVAARLHSLDVLAPKDQDTGSMMRIVKNGVLADEFLQAVSWCQGPEIQRELKDIARRTNDPKIKEALKRKPEPKP